MGVFTEQATNRQLKKGQGETNDYLATLLDEQRETNRLLAILIGLLTPPGSVPPPPPPPG
jgi:hypothetical protein